MEIFNIKKFSLHDGPGIRTTVFMRGCPLNCIWCHNPESFRKSGKENGCNSELFQQHSPEKIVDLVLKDRAFYDESGGGVTFSGGEPLMQHRELEECLGLLRDEDINTAVDTSGFAGEEIFRRIGALADIILFDLKLYDSVSHKNFTGVNNDIILRNFEILAEINSNVIVRIPLIPDITDTEENLLSLGRVLAGAKSVVQLDLLPYNELADSKYKRLDINHEIAGKKTQSSEELERIKSVFSELPIKIMLRG